MVMTGNNLFKLLLLAGFVLAGGMAIFLRREEETVTRYSVTRPKPTHRMLGAIMPRADRAWFLKLTGTVSEVDKHAEAFRQLVATTEFGEGSGATPVFKLPEGWTQQPGGEMRFATIKVPSDDSALDLSVTVLPLNDPDLSSYLLANINRWRDQMRLRRITRDELSTTATQVSLGSSGQTATMVDLLGFLSAAAMGQAAPAKNARPVPPAGDPKDAANAAEKITFDAPSGWVQGQLEVARLGVRVPRLAAFEVADGAKKVEITITKLPPSSPLGNVNRWRNQIGLEELTAEQYPEAVQQIEFAGGPADYVRFFGKQQAILGVMAIRGDTAWFVKLQGDTELAQREIAKFEEFVRSVRIP